MEGFMVPTHSGGPLFASRQQQMTATQALNARIAQREREEAAALAAIAAAERIAAERAAAPARRRLSYMIPPPTANASEDDGTGNGSDQDNSVPLLALPSTLDDKWKKSRRGNPNPLIVLRSDVDRLERSSNSADSSSSNNAAALTMRSSRYSSSSSNNTSSSNGVATTSPNTRQTGAHPSRQQSSSMSSVASSSGQSSTYTPQPVHGRPGQRHPEHVLGITSFALDTSTAIAGTSSKSSDSAKRPQGILYTGGRDGLVASWELGLPLRKRDHPYPDWQKSAAAYVGSRGSHAQRRAARRDRYIPPWAEEDEYASDDDDDDLIGGDQQQEMEGIDDVSQEVHSSEDEDDRSFSRRRSVSLRDSGDDEDDVEGRLQGDDDDDDQLNDDSEYHNKQRHAYRHTGSSKLNKRAHNGMHSNRTDISKPSKKRSSKTFRNGLAGTSSSSTSSPLASSHTRTVLPYEQRWEIDHNAIRAAVNSNAKIGNTVFRQAHRSHTDWVNDVVLCNLNQTVISASSDRSIRAWNPHDPHRSMLPAQIGSHADYVKCLTNSRDAGWVASGGFDKKLKLWDVHESRPLPIVQFDVEHSVYANSCNATGALVACGSPERIVRVYDPRSATTVARLVGHADNVRALLVSDDGKHILSASSDASVKLWSVGMQRCLHTFTHHADSVWALFSAHPHLEIFYSGDRAGAVCKVDFADCGDIAAEGECVVLCRNRDEKTPGSPSHNDGITRIVAVDDTFLWTASGSANRARWRDIQPRAKRSSRPSVTKNYAQTPQQPSSYTNPLNILSSSPSSTNGYATPTYNPNTRDLTSSPQAEAAPLFRSPSNDRSVAFASHPSYDQRPANAPPAPGQRAGSVRSGLKQSSSFSSPIALPSSPGPGMQLTVPSSPPAHDAHGSSLNISIPKPTVPSVNQIPLESLVPLFTPDDPYARTAYGVRGDGMGGRGYSASLLSLHRTQSRVQTSTSPFGIGFGAASVTTPPTSTLAAPRPPPSMSLSTSYNRASSPMPNTILGAGHHPASIVEEDEEAPILDFGDAQPQPQQVVRNEAYIAAFHEFEDRDSALDAVPLRSHPDEIMYGRPGLVRTELLNDRRTVVSLDTTGSVAVWDIILGGCIGRFAKSELKAAQKAAGFAGADSVPGSPTSAVSNGAKDEDEMDILELVRLQIEGEATVPSWCSVESKIGSLTVHIEQNRAFDAEVYLDEAGVQPLPEYKVDQRLNLGKWIIRNLLDGFVRESVKKQSRTRPDLAAGHDHGNHAKSPEGRGAPAVKRPSHISIPDSHAQFSGTPNSFHIALATPAMTPAILPDKADFAAQMASPLLLSSSLASTSSTTSSLSTIPQSPFGHNSNMPSTPSSAPHKVTDSDYFSHPPSHAPDSPGGGATPKPALGTSGPLATPMSQAKVSKLNRFKSFGRKEAKRELEEQPSVPAVDEKVEEKEDEKDAHLSPADKAHARLVQTIFSKPLLPPSWLDTPPIRFASDLPIMIGEEGTDAGAFATIYRSPISRTGSDATLLQTLLPAWLLEYTLQNTFAVKDQVKIAFVMEPWRGPEKAGFAALPSGNARLSATRMLRMRKAAHYIAEKLELESWKQRQRAQYNITTEKAQAPLGRTTSISSMDSATHGQDESGLLPEDEVEILCNEQVVPLNMTLAACAKYCYGRSGDIQLFYRKKAHVA